MEIWAPMLETLTLLNENDARENEINSKIKQFAKELKFPLQQIYKMDSKGGSHHSNAILFGFGSVKKIILYDNIVTSLSPDEILAIAGHEIGHSIHHHLWQKFMIHAIFVGNFIYLFSSIVRSRSFYASFGFESIDASVGLILFSYLYNSFANIMLFATNFVSRSFEYRADEYAIDHGLEIDKALIKLHAINNPNICPDKYYSIYHYSHPSLQERLQRIESYKKKHS